MRGVLPMRPNLLVASDCSRRFPLISRCVSGNLGHMKRLLIEVVIIGGLIWFAWNKPFGVWTSQTYTSISDAFDRLGGSLQKNQDQSVKRY